MVRFWVNAITIRMFEMLHLSNNVKALRKFTEALEFAKLVFLPWFLIPSNIHWAHLLRYLITLVWQRLNHWRAWWSMGITTLTGAFKHVEVHIWIHHNLINSIIIWIHLKAFLFLYSSDYVETFAQLFS